MFSSLGGGSVEPLIPVATQIARVAPQKRPLIWPPRLVPDNLPLYPGEHDALDEVPLGKKEHQDNGNHRDHGCGHR